jgi:DNA-binding MarR family transcriptional regulator
MTASEIGARANMHKTKISRAVQKLTERRFVTRARDDADRRVEHLALTAQGQAAYDDLHKVARRYDGDLTADLSSTERAALKKMLLKLSVKRPAGFT